MKIFHANGVSLFLICIYIHIGFKLIKTQIQKRNKIKLLFIFHWSILSIEMKARYILKSGRSGCRFTFACWIALPRCSRTISSSNWKTEEESLQFWKGDMVCRSLHIHGGKLLLWLHCNSPSCIRKEIVTFPAKFIFSPPIWTHFMHFPVSVLKKYVPYITEYGGMGGKRGT